MDLNLVGAIASSVAATFLFVVALARKRNGAEYGLILSIGLLNFGAAVLNVVFLAMK